MKFAPYTNEDIFDLWPAGDYDYETTGGAVEKESKSKPGNYFVEIKTTIFHPKTGQRKFITERHMPQMKSKLSSFCRSHPGLEAKLRAGSIETSDFEHKSGKLKLGIEEGKDGFDDKNVIKGYIVPKPSDASQGSTLAPVSTCPAEEPAWV